MADRPETTIDTPAQTGDAAAYRALSSEANSAAKLAETKSADQGAESKINAMFGSLAIIKGEGDKTVGEKIGAKQQNGDGSEDVAKPAEGGDSKALQKIIDDAELKASRKSLLADISKQEKGLDKGSAQFSRLEDMRTNMDILELRAAVEQPPLKPEEINKTYKAIAHLISAKDGPDVPVNKHDRLDLAQQIMLHAADPSTIDQGYHDTCSVTTAETRLFTKNPAAAAALIQQVATSGEYRLPGGNGETLKINPDSIKRNSGNVEELNPLPLDGDRSFASQIFQVTAVNAFYKTHDLLVKDDDENVVATYTKGTTEYRQEKADQNATPPTTGEAIYDISKNPPVAIKDANGAAIATPFLSSEDLFETYNLLSQSKDSGFLFVNKDYHQDAGGQLTEVGSAAELTYKLQEAQKNGKMPIILDVYSGMEPFYSDSSGGAAGGAGGAHVVTVTGIDSEGKAIVDNQWGKKSKHSVDMKELYMATLTPRDAVTALKQECAKNAADHKHDASKPIDFALETELLRLRNATGDLGQGHEEYRKQLIWLTREAVADATKNNNGILDKRTEIELQHQLAAEFGKGGKHSKDWQDAISQVWADPMRGIIHGNGNIALDERGYKRTVTSDYGAQVADAAAKQLYDAGDATFYFNKEDYQKMDLALAHKSPAEIEQMDQQFKAKYGKTIEDYIKDRFSNHQEERDRALKLLEAARQGQDQEAA